MIEPVESTSSSNIAQTLAELHIADYPSLHQWSVQQYEAFWAYIIHKLHIQFDQDYHTLCALDEGFEQPKWLVGAKLNIANSCFQAPKDKIAIIAASEASPQHLQKITYGELNALSDHIAQSLTANHYKKSDAIAIIMPMNIEAVAIYLGIIKAGMSVVSIAESFAAEEIATRLNITHCKAIFTQDFIERDHKFFNLYEKICKADAQNIQQIIYLKNSADQKINYRSGDIDLQNFLVLNKTEQFKAVSCDPDDVINYLFSSGTTGEPKAIGWNHTTPIKSASDAYFHCDVTPHDIITMPTSLGWMMGPWLVFAGFLNGATLALFEGSPTSAAFGEFIQNARVSILGVVPSLVASWRASHVLEKFDWSRIKLFFSTGECSNSDDMRYLMSLPHKNKKITPIIEYCGGTETGGAYITSTVAQPNLPALLTTPAMGMDFILLNNQGEPDPNVLQGEVALIPPSMGLTTSLLNRDHHEVYYANMPSWQGRPLRRHGDQIEKVPPHYFRMLGRVDDTMNLGGIKVSALEIERVLLKIEAVQETAAIAVAPQNGGPNLLIIYAVIKNNFNLNNLNLRDEMQQVIRQHLNPLFKIHEVIMTDHLPRTASNKIMRRELRAQYLV